VILDSPIGRKWSTIGGPETTGRAISDPTPLEDRYGLIQMFVVGVIYWSPAFGAVYMTERVWKKWASLSVEKGITATGDVIQNYLGYPTEDSMRRNTQSGVQEWMYFERGMVYVGPEGAHVVYGDIYAHYRLLGGLTGLLGVPVSDEQAAPGGGRVFHFVHGDIYQHGNTGAREVHGAIRDRYIDMGGPAGVLGYPTSDEQIIENRGREIGRFNRFENGSGIYYSPTTGAWDVYGAIWQEWQKTGGPTGRLGFPTSGETDTPTSGGRYNEFQHGVIVWHGGGPYDGAHAVNDLKLVLHSFTAEDNFNVQAHVEATPDQVRDSRMPADGEFDGGVKVFEPQVIMIDIDLVRASSVIRVTLRGISENLIGEDDRLGIISETYSVDRVWGLLDKNFDLDGGSFRATVRVQPKTAEITTNPHELFWPFVNTSTFKLSWEDYARTFRDVNESDKHVNLNPLDLNVHPWEIFLYEAFYNSLAEGGACFGMCLEAVYARENASLFLEPLLSNPFNPYQRNHQLAPTPSKLQPDLPGDQVALDAVNVKHGYQMGAGLIEWFLRRWTAGALHDPERAYRESYDDFQAGNWPLLTISDNDKFSQNGHAVLPYEWDPPPHEIGSIPPGQALILHVKNPNYPQAPRGDIHCLIAINPVDWTWSFQFDDSNRWTGSGESGGRLLAIPFTELNARPVTPGSVIAELIAAGVYLVLGGSGETEQITDGYGRTFFRSNNDKTHERGASRDRPTKEINWDEASRIPNLMEVPVFHGTTKAVFGSTTVEGKERFHLMESRPEIYYRQPGPPPRVPAADRKQSTVEFVGVGSSRSSRAAVRTALPEDALHHQIRGKGRGKMRWVLHAPRMSAAVVADTEEGIVDSIHMAGLGGHFQNVIVRFPNATRPRQVSMTVTGWQGEDRAQARSFTLENMLLDRNDSVRAQISDGGRELMVENAGPAKAITLRLSSGFQSETVTVRSNISLDAASVVRFRASDWSPAAPTASPIHMDVLDKGGNVLRTLAI
jgi:hypothetical protein